MHKEEIIRLYIDDLIAHVAQSPARDSRISQMREELERSDNSDCAKCSEDLFELQSKYDGLLPKETIIRILKKHFA